MSAYVIPAVFVFVLIFSAVKKKNAYSSFTDGAKEGLMLMLRVFPSLASVYLMLGLLKASGLLNLIIKFVSPLFVFLGIPEEITELVLLRPLSGSASMAILEDIMTTYGVDSYVSRSAAAIMGSSETVFYVASVYFSGVNKKQGGLILPASFFGAFISAIFACVICRFI